MQEDEVTDRDFQVSGEEAPLTPILGGHEFPKPPELGVGGLFKWVFYCHAAPFQIRPLNHPNPEITKLLRKWKSAIAPV